MVEDTICSLGDVFDKIQLAADETKTDETKKTKSLPNVRLDDKKKQAIADWINDCESITEAAKITGLGIAIIETLRKQECDRISGEASVILKKCLRQNPNPANNPSTKKTESKVAPFNITSSKTEKVKNAGKKILGMITDIIEDRRFGFIKDADRNKYYFHLSQLKWLNFEDIYVGFPVTFDIVNLPNGSKAGLAHNICRTEEALEEISAKNAETEIKIEKEKEKGEEDMTTNPADGASPKSKVKKKRGPKNIKLRKSDKENISNWIRGCKTQIEATEITGLSISTIGCLSKQRNNTMRKTIYKLFKKLIPELANKKPAKTIESIPAPTDTTNEMVDTNIDKNTLDESIDDQPDDSTDEFDIMAKIDYLLSKIGTDETRKRILKYINKKWKGKI